MAGPIVDLVLLRGLFGDTSLRPGLVLPARVLEREGARGTLLLNGVRVQAQLPPELRAGDALRVRVQEVTPERLALQIVRPDAPEGSVPTPTVGVPLPGGARFRVEDDAAGGGAAGGEEGRSAIRLRFDSPALGPLEFLLEVDPTTTAATVQVATGAAKLVGSAANELRKALATATERPATVRIEELGFDVRA
jgi:hypothetical protein